MKKLFSTLLFFAMLVSPACEGTFTGDEPIFEKHEPIVFAASDVSQEHIDITLKWFQRASYTWFKKDSPAFQKFNPLYLVIIGTDIDAANKLNEEFCNYKDHISKKCNIFNGNGGDRFAEYAREGGAAITSLRGRDGYQLMIMGSSRPGPDELDYGYVVLHELFHTYQNAYIALSSENQTQQFYKDLGGKMTGDSDNTVWWSEGVANFLAMSLYAKQPEIEDGFLKMKMRWWLASDHHNPGISVKEEYLTNDKKLYDYTFDDESQYIARKMGDWFIAYLINDFGEQAIFDFYAQLPIIGNWEETFTTIFDKPYREYVDEFDEWLQQPNDELLKIIP